MTDDYLSELTEFSRRYGKNPEYVLAGGGNTSQKDETTLYVKGSGMALADISPDDFVAMDRAKLNGIFNNEYPEDDAQREAAVLADIMGTRLAGSQSKRPSVEAPLHNIMPQKYVLHVHPALVNGVTCANGGEQTAAGLTDDEILWVPLCKPGYTLCKLCMDKMEEYKGKNGKYPSVMLLQNHGIFVGADTVEELDRLTESVMSSIEKQAKNRPDLTPVGYGQEEAEYVIKEIERLYPAPVYTDIIANKQVSEYLSDPQSFQVFDGAFTPDHIVYCKAKFLYIDDIKNIGGAFDTFVSQNGYLPRVICVRGLGAVIAGATERERNNAANLFLDAVKVAAYSQNFGGHLHMTKELTDFILNWEVESYRQSVK